MVDVGWVGVMAGALHAWGASGGAEHYYYAAAVRSMSESWHAFAFGALDHGGQAARDAVGAGAVRAAVRLLDRGAADAARGGRHRHGARAVRLGAALGGWPARADGRRGTGADPISYATARGMFPDTMLVCSLTVAAYPLTRALES